MSEDVLQAALAAHQQGALSEAERLYRTVLQNKPDHADALALLGLLMEAKGHVGEALALVEKAVELDPRAALFRAYLGNVRMNSGDLNGAVQAFREAVALSPQDAEALYNLGNALRLKGVWTEAKGAYEKALGLAPHHVQARNNLALVHEYEGALPRAVEELQRAVGDAPDYAEGWLNLCKIAEKNGQNTLSCEAGLRAVGLMPQNPAAWLGFGVALNRLERDEEALQAYQEALRLKPAWAEVWDNLAQTYQFLGRLDEAEQAFRKAIDVAGQAIPDADVPQVDEQAYGNHHWHLALLELLKGDYKRGFARYRARFGDVGGLQRPAWSQPVWRGQDVAGKTVLVTDEQGAGDCLMMARYLPLLKARGAYVKFHIHAALVPLFTGWEGADEVIEARQPVGAFDFHASIFDLPYAFGTEEGTIPANVPYLPLLLPDEETDLSAYQGKKKIGVVWAGAPLHKQDAKRSVPLAVFARLFDREGAQFFSLNRDKRAGDEALLSQTGVVDLAPRLHSFADSARLMGQMDLLITCDTATAHLAGGMGKPVWTLLPFAPDWRWLTERTDTPWYPTMRLFRQPSRGDWEAVVGEVKKNLFHMIEQQKRDA